MGFAIEVQSIKKSFGNLHALDDVSLGAEEKSLTILMGPNGSGKTTLINVIGGLYKPDSGKVLFHGKDITGFPPHDIYRLGVARTFQIPGLVLAAYCSGKYHGLEKRQPWRKFCKIPSQKIMDG